MNKGLERALKVVVDEIGDLLKYKKVLEIILNNVPLNIIRSYLEKEEQDSLEEVLL